MKIVGLTGGVGSGKTTVAQYFRALGIPVYIADDEAKKLMNNSKVIKRKLIELFGDNAYIDGKLNKPFLADAIFNDKKLLDQMNAIVHPKVEKHFKKWVLKQQAPYVIKEAAVIFENGSYYKYDLLITVVAPVSIRVKRLLKRDKTTRKSIEAIMKNQWSDEEKIKLSHFVICNELLENTANQVKQVHDEILKTLH